MYVDETLEESAKGIKSIDRVAAWGKLEDLLLTDKIEELLKGIPTDDKQ